MAAHPLVPAPLNDHAHAQGDVTKAAIETETAAEIKVEPADATKIDNVIETARDRKHDVDLAPGRDLLCVIAADAIVAEAAVVVTSRTSLVISLRICCNKCASGNGVRLRLSDVTMPRDPLATRVHYHSSWIVGLQENDPEVQ